MQHRKCSLVVLTGRQKTINLCVIGVEMQMQTIMLDQLQKISGIAKKEDRSKNRTLRDAEQHRTRGRRGGATADELYATIKIRRESVESKTVVSRQQTIASWWLDLCRIISYLGFFGFIGDLCNIDSLKLKQDSWSDVYKIMIHY